MQPEVVEFMQTVMEQIGVRSPRELARALGLTGDDERKVPRWVNGESAPDFYNTLSLLSRAGLLRREISGWGGDVNGN